MPSILSISGWRLFFFANENQEPMHIHAQNGDMDCKFWINVDDFEIIEAFAYNLSPSAKREIKRIIYQHFDYIVEQWNEFFKK